jgi:hypothetical protein
MFSTSAITPDASGRGIATRRRAALVKRTFGVLAAALALMAAVVGGASATVSAYSDVYFDLGMDLQCGNGQLVAYAPFGAGIYSSFSSNKIYISTQVDRWDGTKWVKVGTTAEWAYGNTHVPELGRSTRGWPLMYMSYGVPTYWISTGVLSIQPKDKAFTFVHPSVTIPVARGSHYRAFTWLRDAGDGDKSWIQNTTADGRNYCFV